MDRIEQEFQQLLSDAYNEPAKPSQEPVEETPQNIDAEPQEESFESDANLAQADDSSEEEAQSQEKSSETPADPEPILNNLPKHLREKWKDKVSSLDESSKEFIKDYKTHLIRAHNKNAQEDSKIANEIRKANVPLEHVTQSLELVRMLTENPSQVIKNLVKYQNLTKNDIFDNDTGNYEDSDVDPTYDFVTKSDVKKLFEESKAKIEEKLKTEIESTLDYSTQKKVAIKEIEQFREARDEKGSLKYPYFEDLRPIMRDVFAQATQNNKDITLEAAYETAMLLHPDYKEEFLEREIAKKGQAIRKGSLRDANPPASRSGIKHPSEEEQFSKLWREAGFA